MPPHQVGQKFGRGRQRQPGTLDHDNWRRRDQGSRMVMVTRLSAMVGTAAHRRDTIARRSLLASATIMVSADWLRSASRGIGRR